MTRLANARTSFRVYHSRLARLSIASGKAFPGRGQRRAIYNAARKDGRRFNVGLRGIRRSRREEQERSYVRALSLTSDLAPVPAGSPGRVNRAEAISHSG